MKSEFNLGETLKDIRIKRKMSQEEVALKANITTTYYGLVERNKKNPTVKILEKICGAIGVEISELFRNDLSENNNFDDITLQIINQLDGRTYEEKKIVLNIIKQVFKINRLK